MQNREEQINETIKKITDRRFEIKESKEKLIIQFKKTYDDPYDKTDNNLRKDLEKPLKELFKPRAIWINFF